MIPAAELDALKASIRLAVAAHQAETGATQEEIGVRMGISRSSARAAVCQILNEKNNPRLDTLVRLAHAIGFPLIHLLSGASTDAPISLEQIDSEYLVLRQKTRQAIEHLLAEKAGKEFLSLQARQAFAADIRERLQRVGLRIECPKCSQPAMLRATLAGDSIDGVFKFDHASTGHGGSGTLPTGLKVIDAPDDGRVKFKRHSPQK